MTTTTWARRALALVVGVAAIEWALAVGAFRDPLDDGAWAALADDLAALPVEEPVVLADEWLGPSARMHVDALAELRSVGRPDLRGWPRFHVVGLGDAWSAELAADREDLPAPVRIDARDVGPFTITTYEQTGAGTIVADVTGSDRIEVTTDAGRCRGRGELRCSEGTVALRTAEIDYRPRRCLAIDVRDGTHLRIAAPRTATGDVLRGHLGFADFNARLRNDAPVALAIEADGTTLARWTVTDEQGWWPFAVATEAGTHEIAFVIDVGMGGTFGRNGYDAAATRTVCLEARTLQEGG